MFSDFYLKTSGTCTQRQFWLYAIVPFSIITVLMYVLIWFRVLDGIGRIIASLLMIWPVALMAIKRLRHLKWSPWCVVLMFLPVPLVSALLYVALGFIPDKAQVDR